MVRGILSNPIPIASWLTPCAAAILGLLAGVVDAAEPLADAYRTAKAALQSGDAAKCVAILELRATEARGGQRGALLFTLGVALLKIDRSADAERTLLDATAFFDGTPKLAETWALVGDARAAQAKPSEAAQAFAEAIAASASSPDAPIARYAAARTAEIAGAEYLLKGEALPAIEKFRAAAELSADRVPAIQARLGEIAGNRKLRGEPTAAAIFALGEIEDSAGNLPEAIAYYQRVFVSWLKYPRWVARSYLRAAGCFDRLGKRRQAIAHLQEMMRKADRLRNEPEFDEGKRTLRAWNKPAP
jgi:tetratricopeptide (TPR) repeat protein